jgi:hypothetical protein
VPAWYVAVSIPTTWPLLAMNVTVAVKPLNCGWFPNVTSMYGASRRHTGLIAVIDNTLGTVVVDASVVVVVPATVVVVVSGIVVVEVVVVEVVVVEVVVVVLVVVSGTSQSPVPVNEPVNSSCQTALTVKEVPEKLTVADPPPGIVPLEGVAPAAVKFIAVAASELTMLHTPEPGCVQLTVTVCAEAVDAPNASVPIPSTTATMSRRVEMPFRRT